VQRYFKGQIYQFLLLARPDFLLVDDSAGRVAREIWWTKEEFYPVDIIPPWFSMLIYHLGVIKKPVDAAVTRRSHNPSM
jgi:hypothetical protein